MFAFRKYFMCFVRLGFDVTTINSFNDNTSIEMSSLYDISNTYKYFIS